MLRAAFILLLLICTQGCAQTFTDPRIRSDTWAAPVIGSSLDNFYKVDNNLYRSEQPDGDDFTALSKLGIKEILNLREYHGDEDAAENQFTVHRVAMEAGSVTEEQLLAALTRIKNRKAPLLIHCWHGSDRTGVTVAAYRLVFQNWSKQQAIDEMVNGGYGYHGSVYPNLVELINQLDVAKIKQQLQVDSKAEVLLGSKITAEEIELTVASGGCTQKEDFSIDINQATAGQATTVLTVRRHKRDDCKAWLPEGVTIKFSKKELGLNKAAEITLSNKTRQVLSR